MTSPEKAAIRMVEITKNLNGRMHRALPASVIKQIKGIAIGESPLLGMSDCKLIECVLNWAEIPCRILTEKEVEELVAGQENKEAA